MKSIPEALGAAVQHHNAGRLQAAEQIYQEILLVQPDHGDVLFLRGLILAQRGELVRAIAHLRAAVANRPNVPEFHTKLGDMLRQQRLFAESIDSFKQAVRLNPDLAEAHFNVGCVYHEQGQLIDAIANYQQALRIKPDYLEAHNNLGTAFQSLGKLTEAEASYRKVLSLNPRLSAAFNNLGTVLQKQEQSQLDEIVTCFQQAIRLKPDFAEAYYNLGNALQKQGKLSAAVASYQRTLELKPDHLTALSQLVNRKQHICSWKDLDVLSQRVISAVETEQFQHTQTQIPPFSFLALQTPTTALQQLQAARKWYSARLRNPDHLDGAARRKPASLNKTKLTIGYLSADFRAHPVAYLIPEMLELHDREQFVIRGYGFGADDGSVFRKRLIRACDHFVDLKQESFTESAQRIVSDEVDILVDITGYTQGARTEILALRPVPIQVSYLGYLATMGTPFIDYLMADEFVVPQDQRPFFTEQLVYLPGCFQVNDGQREFLSHTPTRVECELPETGFVFCCFNNSYKITPEVFDVWMKLLLAVPGSVLWLAEGNAEVPGNLRREAAARGVASDRLIFLPAMSFGEFLTRLRLADLFLDTFPYNAGATASDALRAGCPVLTRVGDTFVSRMAGSLLKAIGLPELITHSLQEYSEMALRLAQDHVLLSRLRSHLEASRETSPLFNARQFTRDLETAFRTMWETHVSGKAPHSFAVRQTLPSGRGVGGEGRPASWAATR